MNQVFSKPRNHATWLLVFTIVIIAAGANGSLVTADPCIAQLSYPIMPMAYSYNSNIQMLVPVTATCTSIGSGVTAVGDAYDTSLNTDLGSVNAMLSPVNGATFSGQLVFNLPPASLGHSVQILVSIYNGGQYAPGQYGTYLTTAYETVQVNPSNYQNGYYPSDQYYSQQQQITTVTAFVTQMNQQPNYPGLQNTNSSLIRQQFARGSYSGQQDTSWLMGLVVALVIAFSVIVAVVFAVIASRNRPLPYSPRKIHLR